jgi:hypothetical protein
VSNQNTASTFRRVLCSQSINSHITPVNSSAQLVQINSVDTVTTRWATANTTNQSALVAPNSGNFSYFGNGNVVATNATTVRDWGVVSVGAVNPFNVPMDGKLCEVIVVYSSDTTTRQLVEGYLAHKWGLTSNLPNDHPYKTAAPTIGSAGTLTTDWSTINSPIKTTPIKTSNYTASICDRIPCDTAGGSFSITLPVSSSTILIFDSIATTSSNGFGANALTILPNSGDTIMGGSSLVLNVGGTSIQLEKIGTDWKIISKFTL